MDVGPYRLESLLGKGGFGEVWKAWDGRLSRWVAMKLPRYDEPEEVKRFAREAQTAARLSHPNIAVVYEATDEYIAMQLVDGRPPGPGLPAREAARIVRDAALAVGAAHAQGVVHRDLKPSNLLVDEQGAVFVVDFGLARAVRDASLTVSGAILGTPRYMSPEQTRGERADARSDVWSLGATLYELLAGRPPFAGRDAFEVLRRVCEEEPPRLAAPPEFEAVVLRCLEKDPRRRYADGAALAADLTRWLEGEAVSARPIGAAERLRRRLARRRGVIATAALSLAAIAAAAALIVPRLRATDARLAERAELQPLEDAIREAEPLFYVEGDGVFAALDRVRGAIDRLRAVEPKDARIWGLIGRGCRVVGDYAAAEEALGRGDARDAEVARQRWRVSLERTLGQALRASESRRWGEAGARHLRDAERRQQAGSAVERDVAGAQAAIFAGRADRALEICASALERHGDVPGAEELWLLRGYCLEGKDAFDCMSRALQRRPHYPLALMVRAVRRWPIDGSAAALGDADRAIRLHPRWSDLYVNRAALRVEAGDPDGAFADCEAALAIEPGNIGGLLNRAAARRHRGDLDGAIADCTEALRLKPDSHLAFYSRALARTLKGDLAGALADFDASIRIEPAAPAHAERARAHLRLGDLDAALAGADRAIEINPQLGPARVIRSMVRARRGDVEGALADAEEALRLGERSLHVHTYRGAHRLERGDREGALEDFDAAVAIDPRYAEARINRAIVRAQTGNAAGAREDLDECVRANPDFPEGYSTRGWLRERQGDAAGAIGDFERALAVAPADWPKRAAVQRILDRLRKRQ